MKVFIVDDDPMLLRAAGKALALDGWDVERSLKAADIPEGTDVVLADWHPHGLEMTRKAKAADAPVVIMTGDYRVNLDPWTVVPKPFTAAELSSALRKEIPHGIQEEDQVR